VPKEDNIIEIIYEVLSHLSIIIRRTKKNMSKATEKIHNTFNKYEKLGNILSYFLIKIQKITFHD